MTALRRRRTRALAGCLTLLALVTVTSCGLRPDDEPHAIQAEDLPADLLDPNPPTSTTAAGTETTASVTVYLIDQHGDSTRLMPVEREVVDPARPDDPIEQQVADALDALLATTSAEEQDQGLISSIPADTALLGTVAVPDDDEIRVNLSSALFDVEGEQLANAFAQLVWTVTEVAGVRQVRFQVDGVDQRAPNAEGIEQDGAVMRADYSALTPER